VKKDRELTLLLECRHPNIILALGVCSLAPPLGLVLVTERTWGTVEDALDRNFLGETTAVHLSAQVHAALHYMRTMHFCHGAVDISNVALLQPPAPAGRPTAKLTNFTQARSADDEALRTDFRTFAIFTATLFVNDRDTYVALRSTTLETMMRNRFLTMSGFEIINVKISAAFPTLGALLRSVVLGGLFRVDEMDDLFLDFHHALVIAEAALRKKRNNAPVHRDEQTAANRAEKHEWIKL
jgi:serine/threonine protein kinase